MPSERVTFPSLDHFLLRDLGRRDGHVPRRTAQAELYVPEGRPVARPCVVVMPGLSGVQDGRERAYAAQLAERGLVAMVVDSFGSRGAARLPDVLRALLVSEAMMAADAYGALRFLCRHPAADPERIFVMGFSYGGMIAVLLAYRQIRALLAEGDETFAGHVSYYGCSVPRLEDPTSTGRPVLMMVGERDRNVCVERTRLIAEDLRAGGAPVDVEVLPDAYHQWDVDIGRRQLVLPGLSDCALQVDSAGDVVDELSGRKFRGRLSRALILLRRCSLDGFHMQGHRGATRRSDDRLIRFLSTALGHEGAERLRAFARLVVEPRKSAL